MTNASWTVLQSSSAVELDEKAEKMFLFEIIIFRFA